MVLRLQEALDLKVAHAAFSLPLFFSSFFLRGTRVGVCVCGGGGGGGCCFLTERESRRHSLSDLIT